MIQVDLTTLTIQVGLMIMIIMASGKDAEPGSGIRNSRTTHAFKVINFELFAKPVR